MECRDEYAVLATAQEPKWRVKALLMKLDSDDRHGTEFANKFVRKVEAIFSGLPKPKDWQTFQKHDLPLLFTPDEVQQFALEHRLNKAQTKAVNELAKAQEPKWRVKALLMKLAADKANETTYMDKFVHILAVNLLLK